MMVDLRRLPGWEARLEAMLLRAEGRDFSWGECDCCLLAADAVQALTGHDPAADWRGLYRSRKEASVRLVTVYGTADLAILATEMLGAEIPLGQARRGDIAAVPVARQRAFGGVMLGVVEAGGRVACLTPGGQPGGGLKMFGLDVARHAWKVG